MNPDQLALTGQMVLGYGFQWLFGLKKVSNWVVWGGLAVTSVFAFLLATPEFEKQDWRTLTVRFISFMLAAKGSGAFAKAIKAAPATDSI